MVAYLHCELTARDLDARLLIASYILRAGFPVVIGQRWGILANLTYAPTGVSVFATANKVQAVAMDRCRDFGHFVIAMDEEVLATKDPGSITRCVHAKVASCSDVFLFQDPEKEALIKAHIPRINGHVSGSARVELIKTKREVYASEVERCQSKGPYILINTNFSLINSLDGDSKATLEAVSSALDMSDPGTHQEITSAIDRQTTNMETLKSILKELRDCRVVLRPHPVERRETWEAFPVEVISGESALPWMLGAELTIHTGSTTGLEAALLGVPCLNIGAPDPYLIVDDVNCSIPDPGEASAEIHKFLHGKPNQISDFKYSDDHFIANGAENIAQEAIKALKSMPKSPEITTWGTWGLTDRQKQKFSVTPDDFRTRARLICSPEIAITLLDDGIFMLRA